MTREEIIEGLKLLEDNMVYFDELLNDKGEYIDVHELLFEAIEVLEQKPCEDAISRADAIANIRILYPDMPVVDIMGARHKWSEKYQQYRDCEKILADLPSIQPKPKTGHWEMCEDADGIYGVCDICGTDADFTHYGKAYPYCPNCGAKMESEDKE
jgi:hypothetical protein